MHRPRLVLADDHTLLLDGLRKLLEPEFDLIATAVDGRSAVEECIGLKPDLLLLDIGLPVMNGIEVAPRVKSAVPAVKILFLTMHTDRVYVEEAFRVGASGYVLKQSAAAELLSAIRTILQGGIFVSPALGAVPVMNSQTDRVLDDIFARGLTQRQREVLQLIAEGKSMREIAQLLNISVRTVEFHKNGIIGELGLRTTAELTRYALEHRITG